MCGRFTLTQPAYIAAEFGLDNFAPVEPEFYEPRFNVAPTQRIVVIPTVDNQREARRMRWGLIPYWAKDMKIGSNLINARAESIATKPAFRGAFKFPRLQILTIEGLLNGKEQPRYPHMTAGGLTFKKAKAESTADQKDRSRRDPDPELLMIQSGPWISKCCDHQWRVPKRIQSANA